MRQYPAPKLFNSVPHEFSNLLYEPLGLLLAALARAESTAFRFICCPSLRRLFSFGSFAGLLIFFRLGIAGLMIFALWYLTRE
jgi:hypothetical protein